jgi:hypothetical protein
VLLAAAASVATHREILVDTWNFGMVFIPVRLLYGNWFAREHIAGMMFPTGSMKTDVFWDVPLCSLLDHYQWRLQVLLKHNNLPNYMVAHSKH